MDPLSDVLSLLKLQGYVSGAFEAGGDWSLEFPAEIGIRFYAALVGRCWLAVDGVAAAVLVEAGDCLLLPRGRAFRVASDLRVPPIDVMSLDGNIKRGGTTRYNDGNDFVTIGGGFTLRGDDVIALIDVLPPIVHIRREPEKAMLRWCLDCMREELRDPQPGGFLVAQQLATLLLISALRVHLAAGAGGAVGWYSALADPPLAAALAAMHEHPADRWTVQTLAERAGMSRTSFTVRFKEVVGSAPIDYLTRWRMTLASDRLAVSGDSISDIAFALGYESESAFSSAFKRVKGTSPRRFGRERRGALDLEGGVRI